MLGRFLSKRLERLFLDSCYTSIDTLPLFYWDKVHETDNLSYLIRTKNTHIKKKRPNKFQELYLKKLWRDLLEQFIARFGFSENILDIDAKEVEIGRLRVERLVNSDRSLGAIIEIAERELAEMKRETVSGNSHELKAIVELEWGYLNPMVITVSEFHSYVKILQARNKKAQALQVK